MKNSENYDHWDNYRSFLNGEAHPEVQGIINELESEFCESEKYPYLKQIVLLGSYGTSATWAVRNFVGRTDKTDIDTGVIIKTSSTEEYLVALEGLKEIDRIVEERFRQCGYKLCGNVRPAKVFMDIGAGFEKVTQKMINDMWENNEIYIVVKYVFPIHSLHKDVYFQKLNEYHGDEMEYIRLAINAYIEYCESVQPKHLFLNLEMDSEVYKKKERLAEMLNKYKRKKRKSLVQETRSNNTNEF